MSLGSYSTPYVTDGFYNLTMFSFPLCIAFFLDIGEGFNF